MKKLALFALTLTLMLAGTAGALVLAAPQDEVATEATSACSSLTPALDFGAPDFLPSMFGPDGDGWDPDDWWPDQCQQLCSRYHDQCLAGGGTPAECQAGEELCLQSC